MKLSNVAPGLLAVAAAIASPGVCAETLYKLIDKNGKVTYVDKPPKDFDGQVIRLQIDPNANRATWTAPGALKSDPSSTPPKAVEKPKAAPISAAERVRQANERLEAARKELENARNNPGEEDVRRVGIVGGGTRPVFTEAYERKIARLEEAVRNAEEEVRRAESAR
jgi:hypothetical protein